MHKRKMQSVALALVLCLTTACAVRNAPQIEQQTQFELNTASQLNDLQRDYQTFFKDLGDAQRQGIVNTGQIAVLNEIGGRLKQSIEIANGEFKAFMSAPNSDKKSQVIAAALKAEQILLELTTKRSQMGGQ